MRMLVISPDFNTINKERVNENEIYISHSVIL